MTTTMSPLQMMEELENLHEFVLEYMQEDAENNRLWEIRFEDVLQKARQEFGDIASPISLCMRGWVVLELDKRARQRLEVKDQATLWQERQETHKAILNEREAAREKSQKAEPQNTVVKEGVTADVGPASKAKAKAPPPFLPRG